MLYDFSRRLVERKELIKIIKNQGIKDKKVLEAILNTPRELFLGDINAENAYLNNALPIGLGQTISQPYTVAFMTELLEPNRNASVLEIGTGSGYQTYILSLLFNQIFTIERIEKLSLNTQKLFEKLKISNVNFSIGDGSIGWNDNFKFDRIIVTAAGKEIPESLKNQLNINGILVMPVGTRESQIMIKLIKITENNFEITENSRFQFVPLIGKEGWQSN